MCSVRLQQDFPILPRSHNTLAKEAHGFVYFYDALWWKKLKSFIEQTKARLPKSRAF